MPSAEPEIIDWGALSAAAADPVIDRAIAETYEELAASAAELRPICCRSGRCCDFDAHGHRLYVTALEIAWVLLRVGRPPEPVAPDGPCPFLVGRHCGVHTARPLGCRAFFCEPGTQRWQTDATEHAMKRLRRLHEAHEITYRYLEWRHGLQSARAALV